MKQITEKCWIAVQLEGAVIRPAVAKGIVKIINNRPDEDEVGRPTAMQNRQLAESLGLAHVEMPVAPGQISEPMVRGFQKEMATTEGPVIAHCRSRTRFPTLDNRRGAGRLTDSQPDRATSRTHGGGSFSRSKMAQCQSLNLTIIAGDKQCR